SSSIGGLNGRVRFINMKLQNDDDVRTMFSIFSQYNMKGPIELDATLVRYVQDICSGLICPMTLDSDEVEVVDLALPQSCLYLV
ncbi:photosystem I P700 chlorophyll a apoprotein, partial [Trifolium medium]|nr:photosystem I P700 chlorophyll a apoprotein [Trifolium medium]